MNLDEQLSANFKLVELVRSPMADRHDIDNTDGLTDTVVWNLRTLTREVLQPVRDKFGTVIVSSGYRCLELNRLLKSDDNSDHRLGRAADFECPHVSNWEVIEWIRGHLNTRQLIAEFMQRGDPNAGWIHASIGDAHTSPYLIIDKSGRYPWT